MPRNKPFLQYILVIKNRQHLPNYQQTGGVGFDLVTCWCIDHLNLVRASLGFLNITTLTKLCILIDKINQQTNQPTGHFQISSFNSIVHNFWSLKN